MTPAETRAALVEAMARVLHADDVAQTERAMKAEGAVLPERWADPWHSGGGRQLAALRQRARRLLHDLAPALSELGLKIVPIEATEEMARVSAMREVIPKVASGGVITMFAVNKWSATVAAAPDVLGGPDAD